MNRIYRTLWSAATQSWQAVPETAKSAGKKSKSSAGGVIASVALSFSLNGVAHAQAPPAINQLPTGGAVARGTATISQTATAQAAAMVVNQSSQRAVINWNTFNLGSAASINFVQPNAQSVTLNRVNDSNPSQIFGRITANGQVFLTNANGVYFSPTSSVDVGAFTATTHSITDDNFMSGRYVFDRNGATGKIVNEGNITAALGGYVALLAPEVQNAGVVVARAGMVALASGEAITLSIDGSGSLAGITTTPNAIASLVENKLAVLAPDGQIILSAVALDKLQAGVVRNSGTLDANSLVNKGGKIVLEGDEIVMDRNSRIEAKGRTGGGVVLVGGDWQGSGTLRQATKVTMEAGATIDASATDNGDGGKVVLWSDVHNANSVTQVNGSIYAKGGANGGNGGQVETSGHQVDIAGALVNAGADQGKGGNWLLDPYDYTITATEATTIKGSLDTGTSFTVDTTNATSGNSTTIAGVSGGTGTITVSNAIGKTAGGAATLTLNAANNIVINAGISSTTGALSLNMTAGGSISGSVGGTLALFGGAATFNQATDGSFLGVISGNNNSLIKSGAGTLTLSGLNTYTGGNTINAGTLKAGGSTALGTGANTVNSGAVLDLNGYTLSTAGGLTLKGTGISNGGALINSSATAASYSGLVTLGSDTLITGGAGQITLANMGTINLGYALTLDGSAGGTVSSKIASTGALNKQGTGTWILTGSNNNYSGTTTISAGNLQLGSTSVGTTTIGTGPIVNNATLTISAGPALNFAPNTISGTGQLIVGGSTAGSATYTFTLRSDNTYSGGTTINSGPRVVVGGSSTGAAGAVTSGPFGTGTVTFGSGGQVELAGYNIANTLKSTSGAGSPSSPTTTAPTIYLSTGSSELSGPIDVTTAGSGLAFAPVSGSTLRLTGTLSSETAPNYNNSKLALVSAGSVFEGFSSVSNKYVIGLTTAAGNWTWASDAGNAIGLGTKAGLHVYGGTFDLAGNDLGATLDGLSFTLSGGTLLNSATTSSKIWTQNTYMKANSTISTPNVGGDINWTGSSYIYGNAAVYTLTKTGLGDLHIQGTYISGTTDFNIDVQAGNLWLEKGGAGSFAGNYSLAANTTLHFKPTSNPLLGTVSGAGAVVVEATSTMSGANTYTGGTTVVSGATLTPGRDVVMSGSTIVSSAIGTGSLTLGNATSAGTYSMNGYSTLVQNIIVNGAATISTGSSPATNQTISGLISDGSNAGQSLTFITSSSTAKTLEITGSNTYTGPTTVNSNANAGILVISNANALGVGTAPITIAASSTLKLKGDITFNKPINSGGNSSVLGSLSGNNTFTSTYSNTTYNSAIVSSDTGSTLTFAPTTGNAIFSGTTGTVTFQGVGTIAVNGPIAGGSGTISTGSTGSLTFSGVNTYAGTTNIGSGSTLVISGAGSLGGGSYAGSITNLGTFKYDSSATQTLSGVISGTAGALIDSGTGTLTLTGANTYTGTTTINAGSSLVVGSLTNTTAALGTGAITDNGNLLIARSGNWTLSSVISSTTATGGTGNITLQATGTLGVNKTITMTGANSAIYVEAGVNSAANTSLVSDVTLNNTITTSATGTIAIFAGSPTATVANGSTTNLSAKMAGATGTVQYKTYNADLSLLSTASTVVAGTRNFYYRVNLTGVSASSISATKTYDGTTNALGYTSVGNVSGLSADESSVGAITNLAFTTANFSDANAGTGKTLTVGGASISTAAWSVKGLSITTSTGSGTINKANLVLSGSKIYDGTTTVTGAQLTATGVNSESFTVTGSVTTGLATADVQSDSTLSSVTGLTVGTSNGTNPGLASNYNTFTTTGPSPTVSHFSVTPATAVLTATKTYDGTTNLSGSQLAITGVTVGGVTQTLGYSAGTASLLDANVATANNYVLSSGLVLTNGTGTASNYVLPANSYSSTYNRATVNALPIAVTLTAPSSTYTYDAQTTYASIASTLTAYTTNTAMANGDSIASLNYAVSNSGVAQAGNFSVTPSLNSLSAGAAATNYSFTFNPLTVSVAKAALTVSGTTVANKVYDRTTTATLSGGTLSGVLLTDQVTLTQAGTFASANAGTGIAITANDTLGGASANNYTLTQPTGLTADITPKALTVTGTSVASKTYDRTTTATLSGGSLSGVIAGDTVTLTQAGTFASANVGTGIAVTANDSINNSNYTLTQPTGLTADITPKALTVAGTSVANKTYDRTTTAALSSGSLVGVILGDSVTLTEAGTFASANAGTGIAVTANDSISGNSNYTLTQPTGLTANITAKALTVTGTTVANKVYDKTTTASLSGGSLSGVIAGDTVTLTEAGTFASANAGTGIAVTANDSINNSNYTLTQPTGLSADITQKALTVTGTSVASKTYDRTTTAALSGGSLVGVIAGDSVTLTQAGTFASANVGAGIAVTANDSLGGSSASNYTITQPTSLSADITAKALTVTGTNVANKTYDRTTTAALSGGSLVGVIAGDSVTLTEAGTFASANAGTGIAVTANDSINNSNYTLTQPTGLTANITPKALTVSGTSVASKTYSGTNTASLSGGSLTGVIAGDTVTLTEAGTFASANAGAGIAVTASDSLGGSSASNYALTQPTGLTGTINKANATVTASSNTSTYTGLAQSVNGFTVSGLVNNETAAVLTGVSAGATGTNAGTYASVASGTDSNYNLTFVNGALTINKANATVTASSGTVTYTGVAQSVNGFTATGLVNGETTAVLTGVSASATGTNAGTYASVASGSASNYNLTFVNGALTINKANATVTANGGTVTYTGLAQSVSGFTASGLVNGETTAVLTGVSTTGGTGTNAGSYTHTASGTAANYNLTFVNGALSIGKANATVTANGGTTTYNGAAQSVSGFTATGLVNGETTAVLSGVTAGATGTNAGTYTSTASGTDSNYNLSFVNGTYTINKAPLTVSLTGQTKVYDGTTSATLANGSLTLTGFVSGQGATVTQTQASYNSANVLNATTVTASLAAGNYTANNGTLLSNYVLPTTASGTGSITPARLSATGTKTYDGLVAFDATGLTVSGVNGETFAATGSGTMGSKNVQTNQALSSIAGLSLSGNNGALTSNYEALAVSDTQVSVTPRAVNLGAPAASKTYDGTTLYQASAADLTTLSNQLVGTDRVTAAEVVYATKDAGTGKRVSLNSVTISDDNGGNNYTVGKLDVTTGVINKAQLTVTVVSDARFVTQADTAGYAGVVYNGFVGGETASVVTAGSIARSNPSANGAGQYTGVLQASGWQSGNYNITYNAGDYTIVGAHTLLVSVPTASTTYGTAATYVPIAKYLDSVNNTIVTLNPTMTGNALSVSDGAGGTASFAITAANATLSSSGNVQAGGYNLQASNVVKTGSNFQNLVMTGGLTVNPKVLNSNLGVQAITKVYDGSASISNLGLNFNQTLAGVTTGDTVSLVGSGSFDDRHVATNKTVNLSLGLLGADAPNYALVTPSFSANTGSITQLASVTYTGATNGNWADFSNWAGGAMPDRNNVAQVVVPTGKTVVYNSDQVGTIGSALTVNGAVRFTSSNAFTLANTVSGAGDLQQRGNGMLTVSGSNANFSGNLDIGSYQATLNNAQALGSGHVVSSGGQLSVASGVTLAALQVDGAVTVDTAIKTTGDQVYNGALTFLSSGTAQAPNFVSNSGDVDFMSTVSAGPGAMTAQRSLFVSAPNGSVLINDQVGRSVKNLDFNTYLSTGLLDTSPYAFTVTAPTIKLYGDVTTFDSHTYNGAMRVGSNGQNGHTRLLVSVDPSITFNGTVDDADPTGKVNGLDVRAISLAALTANSPVPTITFEGNVGSTSPLASLRLAAGTQSTAAGALVTDIKTDDTSRRDTNYKGDIVLKGDLTVDAAPEMIAEQLLVPNTSQTLTWYTGTPDFRLRLPALGTSSVLPTNLQLVQWGQSSNSGSNNNSNNNTVSNTTDNAEAGRQWLMAHDSLEHATQVRANEAAMKTVDTPSGRMVADVQVGNEATSLPTVARGTSSRVEAQTVNVSSSGTFVQVREFAPQTLEAQKPFVYELPADTFVHSREKEYIKLSATLSNGANLPRWVKFSAKTRSFSGEAPKHVKSLDVKVTATDRQGKRASTRIRLVFTNGSGS